MTGSWWSPRGRLSRRAWALLYQLPAGLCAVGVRLLTVDAAPSTVRTAWAVYLAVWAWPSLVGLIKRLHDCDYSGGWAWFTLAPLAGPVVLFLVMYAHPGEDAVNRFGPPPLELTDAPR